MNKYLLDTQVVLWAMNDPKRLSTKVRFLLEREKCAKYFSVASVWEIAIKTSLKKLKLPENIDKFITHCIADLGLEVLPLEMEHFYVVAALPFLHRDPFDRILVAQAKREELTFVGSDGALKGYGITTIW